MPFAPQTGVYDRSTHPPMQSNRVCGVSAAVVVVADVVVVLGCVGIAESPSLSLPEPEPEPEASHIDPLPLSRPLPGCLSSFPRSETNMIALSLLFPVVSVTQPLSILTNALPAIPAERSSSNASTVSCTSTRCLLCPVMRPAAVPVGNCTVVMF